MEEIVKHINDTNASYRHPSAGDAKNTDLFLDNEHYEMFKNCGEQITVRFHKENLTQAILFIASILPRKFDQSATHELVKFSNEFVLDQLALLDALFKDGNMPVETFTQVWNARKDVPQKNGKIDKRFYFNGLLKDVTFVDSKGKIKTTKFTIRNYFAGGYSELHIQKAEDNIFDILIENTSEYYNDGKEDGYEELYVDPNCTPSPQDVRKSFIRFWAIVDQHGADHELYVSQYEDAINGYVSECADFESVFSIVDIRKYKKVIAEIVSKHGEMSYLQSEQGPNGKNYLTYSTHKHYIEFLNILAATNCVKIPAEDLNNLLNVKEELSRYPLQQIYYGAPGTGKSFEIDSITKEYGTIRTTFHPDSDYSTFVGAYKPTMTKVELRDVSGHVVMDGKEPVKEDRITYKFVKQAFLKAYLAAWKKYAEGGEDGVQPQFLVIEEINRGNCAQIFGDLFQLLDRQDNGFSSYPIEADADLQREIAEAFAEGGEYQLPANKLNLDGVVKNYKGLAEKIKSGSILLLPSNLYIWATMNTSDQSLFPIDSAFKRRWDWHYVKIANAGKGYKIKCGDETYDWWTFISKMNEKIAAETSSDDKKLGYFFCKPTKEGEPISVERFVSKVMFYLWNDVFKDGNTDDFNVSDDKSKTATFETFYNNDNTVNVENVRKFLVKIVGEAALTKEDDDVPPQEEFDDPVNKIDYTKYSFDGNDRLSKKDLGVKIVQKYISEHADEPFEDLQKELAFGDKVASKYQYHGVLARTEEIKNSYVNCFVNEEITSSDGINYKILSWWNKYNIKFIIDFAKQQGWAVTESTN